MIYRLLEKMDTAEIGSILSQADIYLNKINLL